jgi:hypothetical protein
MHDKDKTNYSSFTVVSKCSSDSVDSFLYNVRFYIHYHNQVPLVIFKVREIMHLYRKYPD